VSLHSPTVQSAFILSPQVVLDFLKTFEGQFRLFSLKQYWGKIQPDSNLKFIPGKTIIYEITVDKT
jgi:hypothetical protein